VSLDHVRRQELEPPTATVALDAVAICGEYAERSEDWTVPVAKLRQACLRGLLLWCISHRDSSWVHVTSQNRATATGYSPLSMDDDWRSRSQ
jgi:hypothetical protein